MPVELVGIALLDSVHSSRDLPCRGSRAEAFLSGGAVVNWVASTQPLDHAKPKPWVKGGLLGGVLARSAGVSDHLAVPSAACDSACAFLAQRLALALPHARREERREG